MPPLVVEEELPLEPSQLWFFLSFFLSRELLLPFASELEPVPLLERLYESVPPELDVLPLEPLVPAPEPVEPSEAALPEPGLVVEPEPDVPP